jgi:hypothetical protein
MRIIKHLSEQIADEIDGMMEYAKDALEWKYSDPELAKTYYELAKTEYGHVEKLHALVVKKVEDARTLSIKPTEQMLAKWDELHKEMIAKTAEAKTYLDMWK